MTGQVKVIFTSTISKTTPRRVFVTSGVKMSRNHIYGEFNGSDVPIADGTGNLWHVGNAFFDNVEIEPVTDREAA